MTAILSAAEVALAERRATAAIQRSPTGYVGRALAVEEVRALTVSHEALRAERDAAQQRNDQSQQEWLAMRAERDAAVATLRWVVEELEPERDDWPPAWSDWYAQARAVLKVPDA